MKRWTILMATFASLFLFSGCGQSGPLYVPGDPSQMAVPPDQSRPLFIPGKPSQVPPEPKAASEKQREEKQDDGESSETD